VAYLFKLGVRNSRNMAGKLHFLDPFPGGSPAVLLLHGLGANCNSWTLQIEPLGAAGFRPIAPDIPGFGGSIYDGRGWNFKRVASNLAGLLDNLNLGNAYVVGLSMGGVIAQQLTLDYPDIVRKLVLASTFAVLRPATMSQWFYFIQRAFVVHVMGLDAQSKIVASRVFPNPDQEVLRKMAQEQISSADPRAYRAAMRNLGLFNSTRRLKEIRIPTLVVGGGMDSTVSPVYQKQLARAIPDAKMVTIPEAGHAVSIDQFGAFNDLLLKFFAN
jgi:3-oxoadipate enol-lactonase